MIDFNAHFDGKVIVPEHAVDLPRDRSFVVRVETPGSADPAGENVPSNALQWLPENAVDDELPGRRSEADAASSLFRRHRFLDRAIPKPRPATS
jgi:hypothetical protein